MMLFDLSNPLFSIIGIISIIIGIIGFVICSFVVAAIRFENFLIKLGGGWFDPEVEFRFQRRQFVWSLRLLLSFIMIVLGFAAKSFSSGSGAS